MKKMMLATLMSSVAFAAMAEKIPVDNRFILDGERQMRGWTYNSPDSFKPYGEVKEVMEEGIPGVRLISAGKQTQLYSEVPIPVKAGEKYRVSAKIRGTGSGSIGFFMYGPKWEWHGGNFDRYDASVDFSGTPYEVTAVMTIPDGVVWVRPQICCYPGGKMDFFDYQVEKLAE